MVAVEFIFDGFQMICEASSDSLFKMYKVLMGRSLKGIANLLRISQLCYVIFVFHRKMSDRDL
jgi:hypothetical protein